MQQHLDNQTLAHDGPSTHVDDEEAQSDCHKALSVQFNEQVETIPLVVDLRLRKEKWYGVSTRAPLKTAQHCMLPLMARHDVLLFHVLASHDSCVPPLPIAHHARRKRTTRDSKTKRGKHCATFVKHRPNSKASTSLTSVSAALRRVSPPALYSRSCCAVWQLCKPSWRFNSTKSVDTMAIAIRAAFKAITTTSPLHLAHKHWTVPPSMPARF